MLRYIELETKGYDNHYAVIENIRHDIYYKQAKDSLDKYVKLGRLFYRIDYVHNRPCIYMDKGQELNFCPHCNYII